MQQIKGKTILDLASDNGHVEMVKFLVTNSAKSGSEASLDKVFEMLTKNITSIKAVDEQGMTKLHWAVASGDMPQLRMLVAEGSNVNVMDGNDYTLLHWAVIARYGEGIKELIDMGANINAIDKKGWTTLHWVVSAGYKNVVEMLIERGADINAKDKQGITPLFCAASRWNMDMVRLLQQMGADFNVKDGEGRSLKRYLKVGLEIRSGIFRVELYPVVSLSIEIRNSFGMQYPSTNPKEQINRD